MPTNLPVSNVLGDNAPPHGTRFTRWILWSERAGCMDEWKYRIDAYPGVYLIAHFASPPSGPADYTDDAIEYVGKSKRLRRRLYQFEQAASGVRRCHSGGTTYFRRHGKLRTDLHVAMMPVWFGTDERRTEEPLSQFYTSWLEAYVTARIAVQRRERDVPPLLNKPCSQVALPTAKEF